MRGTTKTNKMKAQESKNRAAQPEKPNHYTYLKEFRVEQCQLFLQHKCTQHRPYTCFHWHFLNQRRRRPIKKRDGTFSYSPDVYCTKFDENTGICPDGDECPFLHRTAGDTERRYHLRYYKTGMCVHDTDSRGICVKNGPHCAFAHGVDDVRAPVNDIRELQEGGEQDGINGVVGSLEKERNAVAEDPKWQDTAYVLANYKTEPCKRPPRLCRQGYACPQYHNSRDRRRPPKKFKYRSTACPNVKHGDEWGEPANCDGGDSCQYCHSRTEQQFHPEIYKSTKCNDIQQNAYCPRGAFCAFAHVEQEMTQVRETAANENCTGTSFADIIQSALPPDKTSNISSSNPNTSSSNNSTVNSIISEPLSSIGEGSKIILTSSTCEPIASSTSIQSPRQHNVLPPIGSKPRHLSGSSNHSNNSNNTSTHTNGNNNTIILNSSKDLFGSFSTSLQSAVYPKAPGSEREDKEASLRKQLLVIEADPSLDPLEKAKRKQSLLVASNLSSLGQNSIRPISTSTYISSNVSPLAPPFYPTSDTVQSVVGSALEDLAIDEPINLNSSLDRDFEDGFSNSLAGITNSGLVGSSAPVNIPRSNYDRSAFSHSQQSPSSTSSPGFNHSLLHASLKRENSLDQANSFLRSPNGTAVNNSNSLQDSLFGLGGGMSPHNPLTSGLSQSPLLASLGSIEVQRMREELLSNRAKLATWEEGIAQARSACQAWKREVDDAQRKVILAEQSRDEALAKLNAQQKELEELRAGRLGHYLQALSPNLELEKVPLNTLRALQNRLKQDLIQVEKVINGYSLKTEPWSGVVPAW